MCRLLAPDFKTIPTTFKDRIGAELLTVFQEAERRYGMRDARFVIREVRVMGEHSRLLPLEQELTIYVDGRGKEDEARLAGDLAHECIHCLNPVQLSEISVLEEGVAEEFSAFYSRLRFPSLAPHLSDVARYRNAHNLVKQLQSDNPAVVRAMRVSGDPIPLSLSAVPVQVVRKFFPGCSQEMAAQLVAKFEPPLAFVDEDDAMS